MSKRKTTTRSRLAVPGIGLLAASLTLAACATAPTSSGVGGTSPRAGATLAASFKVNTSNCLDPAAATKKVTGTWKIGYSAPLSGPIAGVAAYALEGYKDRIAAQNAAGGVDGVKIAVTYKDDAFTPDKAKVNATYFLESEHVDSLSTFGSGPVGAMIQQQNASCVPLLYPSSSVQAYRNIGQYPWTVQFLPAGDAEASYDVSVIKAHYPHGVKVGIAEDVTASGVGEEQAFIQQAKGTNIKVALVTPSTDPDAAATALAAAKVPVVYDAGITTDCGPLVQALARIGYTPKLVVNPSNCADATAYIAAGAAANGNIVPAWDKDPADPRLASDAGVKKYLSEVHGADASNAITVSGWLEADLTIKTLELAAASPAGMSHVGVIEAARNMSYASPMMINGIKWVSTPTNLVGFDSFQTEVWNATTKTFDSQGSLIKLTAG
jgi:branched-chain amino acid transport system substrate-binding protein